MDEDGIEPKDIELVVSQVNCSRAKAVEALRALAALHCSLFESDTET